MIKISQTLLSFTEPLMFSAPSSGVLFSNKENIQELLHHSTVKVHIVYMQVSFQHSNEIQVMYVGMYLEKVRSFREVTTYIHTYRRTISLFFFLLWWAVSCKLVSIQDSFFYSGLKKECMIAPKLSNGDTLQRLVSPNHLQYARYILRSSLQQSVGNLGAKAHFVQDLSVVCLQADITRCQLALP